METLQHLLRLAQQAGEISKPHSCHHTCNTSHCEPQRHPCFQCMPLPCMQTSGLSNYCTTASGRMDEVLLCMQNSELRVCRSANSMQCQTDTPESDTHTIQTGRVAVPHADDQIYADLPAHLQDIDGPGAQCIIFTAEVVLVVTERLHILHPRQRCGQSCLVRTLYRAGQKC